MVNGDPGRIRQILTNLVNNAIKFTEEGEIVIRVKLHEKIDHKRLMECHISDTGIGIPANKQHVLFDSFTQVDASTTREYGGTGLGLSIVKKLCTLMGGDITVTSQENAGSCFDIRLQLENSPQAQQSIPVIDMQALNVLIVDDNKTNLEVLKGQLKQWKVSVTEASSGAQALAICEERSTDTHLPFFDAAILDMQMPEMDGTELGEKIRANKHYDSMKLIMMTSMSQRGDAHYFAKRKFSAYFPKPATSSDLFDALSLVCEGGDALSHADPLVTKHYIKTLNHNVNAEEERSIWPDNTRLLLVEDNHVNQLVAQSLLNNLKLSSDVVSNGLEALENLRLSPEDAPYTAILMDCQMPEMDGYEASQKIRAGQAGAQYQSIPIIALTANVMKGDRDKCLKAGMNDYLAKPLDPEELNKVMTKWLLNKHS